MTEDWERVYLNDKMYLLEKEYEELEKLKKPLAKITLLKPLNPIKNETGHND